MKFHFYNRKSPQVAGAKFVKRFTLVVLTLTMAIMSVTVALAEQVHEDAVSTRSDLARALGEKRMTHLRIA